MKKILVSVPNTGNIHKIVVFSLLKLQLDRRYHCTIILPTHFPYENNLHHIVNDFVGGDFHFWLNIDSDNPPLRNPLDLIEYDRDIIGLPTPVWHHTGKESKGERPVYWNAWDYVEQEDAYREHNQKDGLQRVDAVGTGCFLVSRRVFLNQEMQTGVFLRQFNPDGTVYKGNDISFCERARSVGFEVWAHYGYPCQHFNNLELNEVIDAFKNLYE